MTPVPDLYGYCDRDQPGRNDCRWGKDEIGRRNGCLHIAWIGRQCPHWHQADADTINAITAALQLSPAIPNR